MATGKLVCVQDYEDHAREHLPKSVWDYFSSGADDELTLRENQSAFRRLRLRPRFLRDVSTRDLTTTILGEKVDMPIGISPSGLHGLAWQDGSLCIMNAAASMNVCMTLPTFATSTPKELVDVAPSALKWFQLYVTPERDFMKRLIQHVERLGYKALVITIDVPLTGNRRAMTRDGFHVPPHIKIANFGEELKRKYAFPADATDQSLSWKDIAWFQSVTTMPIVLKGIMTSEDAELAVQHGVQAVWVSNHGGRQLDSVPATIEVLPEVVRAVRGRVEVYMDGGVRTGTDVMKALALGARAVFVGRPPLWGMAHSGEEGVHHVLQILKDELSLAMALSGCKEIKDINPSLLQHENERAKL
ncbi:HAO1 [Branchiostoma lanceolatum]|uniref:(S)-2-hydroxy-acid oxidase n=1 Tax=Branchiostoma lanceolatum TaxID=7740 RepID=A0A8J9ZAW2_BRALA|nr:HAO1 [Branchiostoma lanceolatum]